MPTDPTAKSRHEDAPAITFGSMHRADGVPAAQLIAAWVKPADGCGANDAVNYISHAGRLHRAARHCPNRSIGRGSSFGAAHTWLRQRCRCSRQEESEEKKR